jgi:hypothetical protein
MDEDIIFEICGEPKETFLVGDVEVFEHQGQIIEA